MDRFYSSMIEQSGNLFIYLFILVIGSRGQWRAGTSYYNRQGDRLE